MGNEGIKKAAILSTSKAHYLSAELAKVGYQTENKGEFFHEFVTVSDVPKMCIRDRYNVGVDCAILMNPQTWIASGHLGGFSDPLMDCKESVSYTHL